MQAELKEIPVGQLKPSPTNPRKNLGDLVDLVESIRSKGVIEPLVVRPHPDAGILDVRVGTLEIVCGQRRHAASERAGLETVPVLVRELDDDQVLDLQLAENIDRADLSPLEEAEAYQLRLERGQTLQHVAERIGRTPSYVAQRLRLLELAEPCREALTKGEITLGVALLLARIPDEKLQEEALGPCIGTKWEGGLPLSGVRELIEDDFMLRLSEAPFNTADPNLVPKAGACATCPKRTGNQTELFADIKSPDLCTDPTCHKSKVDAEWTRRKKEAKKTGLTVLEGKAAVEALHYSSSAWAKLDEKHYLPNGKSKPVRQILGKDTPPAAFARDQNGKIVDLVKKTDLDKALRAQGLLEKNERSTGNGLTASQKAAERKKKIRRAAIDRVLELAVEKRGKVDTVAVFALVVQSFAARVWNEVQKGILTRRKIPIDKKLGTEGTLVAYAAKLSSNDLIGLGLELALRSGAPWHDYAHDETRPIWTEGLKLLGLDFKKLEAEVAAELKQPATKKNGATPKKASGGKAKGKAAPSDGVDDFGNELADEVCRGCGCSELDPCPGGCAWAEPDLCTNCVGPAPKGRKKAPKGEREQRKVRNPGKPGRKARPTARATRAG